MRINFSLENLTDAICLFISFSLQPPMSPVSFFLEGAHTCFDQPRDDFAFARKVADVIKSTPRCVCYVTCASLKVDLLTCVATRSHDLSQIVHPRCRHSAVPVCLHVLKCKSTSSCLFSCFLGMSASSTYPWGFLYCRRVTRCRLTMRFRGHFNKRTAPLPLNYATPTPTTKSPARTAMKRANEQCNDVSHKMVTPWRES